MRYDVIGSFISNLRKEKNMTQLELAEKLGVTDRAVSNWENGKNLPDISLYYDICQLFGISIGELLDGKRKSNYIYTEGNNYLLDLINIDKFFNKEDKEQQDKIKDYLEKMNNVEIATINEKCSNIKNNYNLVEYLKVPLDFGSTIVKENELNRLKQERDYIQKAFSDSDISNYLEDCYDLTIKLLENS